MKKLFLLLLALFPMIVSAAPMSDRIEMGVSPIRLEFTATLGVPVTKTITFYNNADVPYVLYLTAEDCQADTLVGTPKCQASPNVTGDPIYASTWINFGSSSNFTVPPKSERQVTFTITAPPNAIPGGHYGAIFFNNPTGNPNANTVTMLKRIGTLLLITVPGTITYNTVYGSIQVGNGGGGGAGGGAGISGIANTSGYPSPATNPTYWLAQASSLLDPTFSAPILPPAKDFAVDFKIPVKNGGNVHILPVGRIEVLDENGIPLKSIGKESIRSPEGAFVGEKIVDYLPINDEAGNVLPSSERLYNVSWRGFAYETIDGGKSVIKFLSPQDYYKQIKADESPYLFPWEKYRIVPVSRDLKANIYLEYKGANNESIPYEVSQNIPVTYQSLEKSLNYGVLAILLGILFLIWFIFFLRRRDRRLDILEEEVGYIEAEIGELEKGRILASKALAKKSEKTPRRVQAEKKGTPVVPQVKRTRVVAKKSEEK